MKIMLIKAHTIVVLHWGEKIDMGKRFDGLSQIVAMILVQFLLAGNIIISKLADNDGMTMRVMVAYRWVFAAAFLCPVALLVERNKRPRLTWMVIFQSFLSGLLGGALFSNLFFTSVTLISPTFVTAIYNLVPAMTFVVALSFRLETFSINTLSGKAKTIGTVVCVGGAMVLTLYKGSELHLWTTNINLLHHHTHFQDPIVADATQGSNKLYIIGIILAFLSCVTYAFWLILLSKISTNYPCPCSSSALMCIMSSLQSVMFALIFDRKKAQWRLGWDIRLFTAFYLGIMGSGLVVIMMTWCSRKRGPLFVSVFNPLTLVFVGLGSSFLLDETLRLGSVFGAMVIICGVYMVLWGKALQLRLHNKSQFDPKTLSAIDIINHAQVDIGQGRQSP